MYNRPARTIKITKFNLDSYFLLKIKIDIFSIFQRDTEPKISLLTRDFGVNSKFIPLGVK